MSYSQRFFGVRKFVRLAEETRDLERFEAEGVVVATEVEQALYMAREDLQMDEATQTHDPDSNKTVRPPKLTQDKDWVFDPFPAWMRPDYPLPDPVYTTKEEKPDDETLLRFTFQTPTFGL